MSVFSPSRRRPSATRLVTAALTALALMGMAAPAGTVQAAAGPVIGAEYFGVHHAGLHADGPIGWPQTQVSAIRIWDNGVSWRELETRSGVFRWDRIDAHMAKAKVNGASVLLVLGQTPRFHSSRPGAAGAYGRGASAMPKSKAVWTRYVKAVARRNLQVWGGIADFQVWNEANVLPYWSGSPAQMATLTRWTRAAVRSVDPSATLVAPAMVTRLSSQRTWIDAFYRQRVGGRNVSGFSDVLSFQLYPAADGSPESSIGLLQAVRSILAKHGVRKPIWNTEMNFGLVGGPDAGAAARRISTSRQIANVVRTYVLHAQNRVGRVYWYSWDLLRMSNTPMVKRDRVTLTEAGRAFATTRSWLVGTRPAGCSRNRVGTYSCLFLAPTERRTVVWNPSRQVSVRVPPTATGVTSWSGATINAPAGSRLTVGAVPVLIRTPG